jgi:hypothetical protein
MTRTRFYPPVGVFDVTLDGEAVTWILCDREPPELSLEEVARLAELVEKHFGPPVPMDDAAKAVIRYIPPGTYLKDLTEDELHALRRLGAEGEAL